MTKQHLCTTDEKVVIPIQTISFYNSSTLTGTAYGTSCHTYPNDKLLQHSIDDADSIKTSCHTYPNDKLLQLKKNGKYVDIQKLSYLSKR